MAAINPADYPRSIEREPFPADLDGYIDVLRRKIAAGYLVEAHQKMLDKLLAIKAEIPPIDKDEPKGLPKEVYQRLFSLKAIRADNPDDAPQNRNIDAIIQAYRSGTLRIESGKVSYWVNGRQISGLKPRDFDDILTVGMENNADKKEFWVEDPRPIMQRTAISRAPTKVGDIMNTNKSRRTIALCDM